MLMYIYFKKFLIIKFDTTNSQVNSILEFYLSINFYIDITEELSKFFWAFKENE